MHSQKIPFAATFGLGGCLILAGLTLLAAAKADVVVSSAATQNISCSDSVCTPTAQDAVLNVSDLESMLSSGDVEILTTGAGIQAIDIMVGAPLGWSSDNTLSFDAYHSVLVDKPVAVSGLGGLSITTNDGGSAGFFAFGEKGHATFANLSSPLTINGVTYSLESTIAALAAAIANNPSGDYALAGDYDAGKDGTYLNSPIPTTFGGNFEGLGNTISNLSLKGSNGITDPVGLFAELAAGDQPGGSVENVVIDKLKIWGKGFNAGGLVGLNTGTISGSFVSGSARSEFKNGPEMGLLVGLNGGSIVRSGAFGSLVTEESAIGVGGLVGVNAGAITLSYANCSISGGRPSSLGGLVGTNDNIIGQSYAKNKAQANGAKSNVGGLVGNNTRESTIAQAYSTTAISGSGHEGGLIGYDSSAKGSNTSDYWDLDTSNISDPDQGAGHPRNDRGITGLSSTQLQSGLPAGFDPTVWAEDAKINGGFPYLIANPPRK